jgi:hypothetical protein
MPFDAVWLIMMPYLGVAAVFGVLSSWLAVSAIKQKKMTLLCVACVTFCFGAVVLSGVAAAAFCGLSFTSHFYEYGYCEATDAPAEVFGSFLALNAVSSMLALIFAAPFIWLRKRPTP